MALSIQLVPYFFARIECCWVFKNYITVYSSVVPSKFLFLIFFTSWSPSVWQVTKHLESVVIEQRVDVVDYVGFSPRVTLLKRDAVVHHVLVVVPDRRAAVRTSKRRLSSLVLVGIAEMSDVIVWRRLQRRDSGVDRELVRRVHHSAMPFRVRLDRFRQRQELLRRLRVDFHRNLTFLWN